MGGLSTRFVDMFEPVGPLAHMIDVCPLHSSEMQLSWDSVPLEGILPPGFLSQPPFSTNATDL